MFFYNECSDTTPLMSMFKVPQANQTSDVPETDWTSTTNQLYQLLTNRGLLIVFEISYITIIVL